MFVALQSTFTQWRSQNKQVMWAQHGYIQCAHNMHLLYRGTGACSAVKIFDLRSLLRPFLATNTIPSVLPVCSLHVHMKAIAHANNWSLTLHVAFHIILTRAPVNFYVGTGLGMHRCSYATAFICHTDMSSYIPSLLKQGPTPQE